MSHNCVSHWKIIIAVTSVWSDQCRRYRLGLCFTSNSKVSILHLFYYSQMVTMCQPSSRYISTFSKSQMYVVIKELCSNMCFSETEYKNDWYCIKSTTDFLGLINEASSVLH